MTAAQSSIGRSVLLVLLLLVAGACAVPAPAGAAALPDYNFIFVSVANDAGAKFDAFGNDTYNIRFEGIDRGLNALHVSTDPAVNFGQVTETDSQSGTFYATDSGGKGYEDEILLMVAVNGTIPDDFSLRVTADGYTWTPNPERNRPPDLATVTYQPVSLDETFTKEDFIYGPQTWKPTGNEADYPVYYGQDLSDTANTFQLMFIDLNAGVLRPNTALENQGAVRITYSFENLHSLAAFSVYGYCKTSNNGDDMVAWTNALVEPKAVSGYSVYGSAPPVAAFEVDAMTGPAPFTARFTDLSTNAPTSWSWDFGDGDGTNATGQNPVHTYVSAGTYTVKLTATNDGGSDDETKADYITVTPSVVPLPGYTDLPTDPDDDGIYEDLNGNGRMDFADVVLYFNQMTWIGANEPIAAFDLNANGRIDFADIVALFNEI